jgi:hypothetical protein
VTMGVVALLAPRVEESCFPIVSFGVMRRSPGGRPGSFRLLPKPHIDFSILGAETYGDPSLIILKINRGQPVIIQGETVDAGAPANHGKCTADPKIGDLSIHHTPDFGHLDLSAMNNETLSCS